MATFGNTALSGDTTGSIENYIRGGYFQMGSINGIADSITAKIRITTSAKNCKCALYDSSNNLVDNGVTEEITVPTQDATATTFNFNTPKPVLTANAWYYIVVWAKSGLGSAYSYIYGEGGYGDYVDTETYNSYPVTWIPEENNPYTIFAIYCTYTETAAAKQKFMGTTPGLSLLNPFNIGII